MMRCGHCDRMFQHALRPYRSSHRRAYRLGRICEPCVDQAIGELFDRWIARHDADGDALIGEHAAVAAAHARDTARAMFPTPAPFHAPDLFHEGAQP